MVETKTLQMVFANAANGRVTISVLDPRDDLTALDVETAMNDIIAANVISSTGGDLVSVLGARVVTRQVTELITS
ncbi:MAG: hypothetical protein PWQ67_2680 [Clostridia bacterium]|jgi:hypothetical protein|nr:hypothetical protein [Clostridia bacterium]MDN5324226.1 hypothetical protein [Clostridia bacterium]